MFYWFSAVLEMISVGQGEIVLRGEAANRYIGMDSHGNLGTYVSDNSFLYFVYHARYLRKHYKKEKKTCFVGVAQSWKH